MAVWHFKFDLIPTESLRRVFGDAEPAVVPELVPHPDGPRYLEPDELASLPNYWDDPRQAASDRDGGFVVPAGDEILE
jgi:hypothetical protein